MKRKSRKLKAINNFCQEIRKAKIVLHSVNYLVHDELKFQNYLHNKLSTALVLHARG